MNKAEPPNELPAQVAAYRDTPTFDQDSVPAALLRDHNTKAGVWGQIVVLEGVLELGIDEPSATLTLTPDVPGVVRPEQVHRVRPLGAVRFFVRFYK
jgi:tellurite resistance-related uncharacterized protein